MVVTFATMKNYIGQGFGLTVLVICGLSALSLLPNQLKLGHWELRPMDLFSDIRLHIPTADTLKNTVPLVASHVAPPSPTSDSFSQYMPRPAVDSAFFGKILEDYTYDSIGLSAFFAALDSIKSHGRKVRLAFYGDSFIEGDIILGDLRDSLQRLWGGSGVGFVPITSEVARFRRTINHEYSNWRTYSVVKNKDKQVAFGINGFVYYPEANADIRYRGASYFSTTRGWNSVRFFYASQQEVPVEWDGGNGFSPRMLPSTGGEIGILEVDNKGKRMETCGFKFPVPDSLVAYGVSLEGGPGLYIDNFSVRGNTGGPLQRIRPAIVKKFDRQHPYDLVVLLVGLNATGNTLDNLEWYRYELDRTFQHLRQCFPNRPLLIVSVGDRGGKVGNDLQTLKSVPYVASMQRDLARKYGLVFFDLFNGMGGAGSMVAMASHKPALASKDYTHLTFDGGRLISNLLLDVLLKEQASYRRKYPLL